MLTGKWSVVERQLQKEMVTANFPEKILNPSKASIIGWTELV